KLEIF
ncbi:Hydrogenase isoenzymes formation protein HypC, partial [Haemophilus influenzae]